MDDREIEILSECVEEENKEEKESITEEETKEVQEKQNLTPSYLCILAAGMCWGCIGLFNRLLMGAGVSPFSIVVLRNFGGLLVLTPLFLVIDRSVFHVKKEHLKYFFGTGIISILLFTFFYFSCQQICSLAVAAILLYTAPSIVVIFSAILWKEPVTHRKLVALGLTLVGCACVTGVFAGSLTVSVTGVLFGLGAGFAYAMYSIFGRYALMHYSPFTVTYWTFVFGGIGAMLVFFRPAELSLLTEPSNAITGLGLVLISTVVPYLLYTKGLAKVEAGKASIMASVEPVTAALVGVLIFGEPMSLLTAAGILCVLAGVYILR